MKKLLSLRLLLGALGLGLLVLGLCQGGYGDVLGKASRLCLECVGLG